MMLLEVDEWAADHPTSMSTGYWVRAGVGRCVSRRGTFRRWSARWWRWTRSEALHLLSGAADLVGHIPPEIAAGMKQAILRLDGGSLMWLRLLRHIDKEARG